jgi:hypothetical protein
VRAQFGCGELVGDDFDPDGLHPPRSVERGAARCRRGVARRFSPLLLAFGGVTQDLPLQADRCALVSH